MQNTYKILITSLASNSKKELADDDGVFYEEFTRVITNADIPEADDTFDPESFDDKYLNMELDLDRQG